MSVIIDKWPLKTHSALELIITCLVLSTASLSTSGLASESSTTIEEDTYFVLGMLEEYISREFIEDSDKVERFYWGEDLPAYVMAVYLNKIMNELYSHSDIEIRRRQELLAIVHSKEMSTYLNSFYQYEYLEHTRASIDGEMKRIGRANFPYARFPIGKGTLKLAYLAGAYYRYGRGNRIIMSNHGARKGQLLIKLIEDVGCSGVELGTGNPYTIHFEPTEELNEWFDRYPGQWALETADRMIGYASNQELQIYRAVLSSLQNGSIDGCYLSVPCITHRWSRMFGDGATRIPDLPSVWQEALDDHNDRRTELTSLIALSSDSIIVDDRHYPADYDACMVSLTRIGFSTDNQHAMTVLSYLCKNAPRGNHRIAFFLQHDSRRWIVTHYTIKNK